MATPEQIAALKTRISDIERRIDVNRSLLSTARANLEAADAEESRLFEASRRGNFDNSTPEGRAARDAAVLAYEKYQQDVVAPAFKRVSDLSKTGAQAENQLFTVRQQLSEAEAAQATTPEPTPPATAAQTARD